MADVGGDLATLASLKGSLDKAASESTDIKTTLDSALSSAVWRGPNADKFRTAWDQFRPTFDKLQQALSDASTDVRNQHNNLSAAVGSGDSI